jgi:hypothetical protein
LARHFRWVGGFQEAAASRTVGGRATAAARKARLAAGRGAARTKKRLAFVLDLGFGQGIQIGDDFRQGAGATEPGNAIFQRGFKSATKKRLST